MSYKYNQLLKLNLQKDPNLSPVEAEINDLRQKKVTKFFSATDSLEDGEVAEYQGADDAINGLVYGYFYKKSGVIITIPAGTQPLVAGSIPHTLNYNNYTIRPNSIYYKIQEYNCNTFTNYLDLSLWLKNSYLDYPAYYFLGNDNYTVGGKVCLKDNLELHTIISVDLDELYAILDNNITIQLGGNGDGAHFQKLYDCIGEDGKPYYIVHTGFGDMFVHYHVENNNLIIEDWLFVKFMYVGLIPDEPVIINTITFQRVNTQPPTPGVTVVDGVLQISLPVEFSGNITVHGSEVVVTTEQIQSEKDFIKLRYNNPLALASGETSGISVNNYDGNNTDCILAVDKDGWARVGDSSGTLEKIATIEETPTAGAFMKYNATDKELESTTDASNLDVTFTDNDILNNIKSGETLSTLMGKICKLITPFYKFSNENINDNSDLNDYTMPGCYYIGGAYSGGGGVNILNKPVENRGMILIIFRYTKITDTINSCSQLALIADGSIYYRTNTSSWSSWAQIL